MSILNAVIILVVSNPDEVNPVTSVVISSSLVSRNSWYKGKQCKNQGTVSITSPNVYNIGHSEHAIPNFSVFYNIELEN